MILSQPCRKKDGCRRKNHVTRKCCRTEIAAAAIVDRQNRMMSAIARGSRLFRVVFFWERAQPAAGHVGKRRSATVSALVVSDNSREALAQALTDRFHAHGGRGRVDAARDRERRVEPAGRVTLVQPIDDAAGKGEQRRCEDRKDDQDSAPGARGREISSSRRHGGGPLIVGAGSRIVVSSQDPALVRTGNR